MSIDVSAPTGTSLTERVAEEIRAYLARRQVRQSQVARALGVSEQWLSVRLRGVQPIDLNDLELIAGALGASVVEFLPPAVRAGEVPTIEPESPDDTPAAPPEGRLVEMRKRPRPRGRGGVTSAYPQAPVRPPAGRPAGRSDYRIFDADRRPSNMRRPAAA